MNAIDIVIAIPLIWGLYKGFSKGLILEAASFVAFGLAVYVALNFSAQLGEKINEWFEVPAEYLQIISFAIAFLGVIVFVFLLAKLIQKLAEGMALGGINKIGGALFGSLKYALVLSVVVFIIDSVEKSYPEIKFEKKEGSVLYEPIGMIAPAIIPGLKNADLSVASPKAEDIDLKVGLKEKP